MDHTKLIVAQAPTSTSRNEGVVANPEPIKSAEHSGPHIPTLMGTSIGHPENPVMVAGIEVTTTMFSTWIYMILLFIGV